MCRPQCAARVRFLPQGRIARALRRRNEIELCARLLGIAASGLNDNPGLILFTVVTKVAMVLMVLPCFAFLFLAYTNGAITPNSAHP